MGDIVAEEGQVFFPFSCDDLLVCDGYSRHFLLVFVRVADQLREDVLVDQLLHDALPSVHRCLVVTILGL